MTTAPLPPEGIAPEDVESVFAAAVEAAPEGWEVSVIEGEIVISQPPFNQHEHIVATVSEQTVIQVHSAGTGLRAFTGVGLLLHNGKWRPDVVVAPRTSFATPDVEYNDPAGEGIVMVVEVTSKSTRTADYTDKKSGYARAGIPSYLICDRLNGESVLFADPEGGEYRLAHRLPFGKPVPLPAPLSFELETGEFE